MRAEEEQEYARVTKAFPNPRVTMDDFVRHVLSELNAVAVAGIDHVGIGCDFDGGGGFDGLREVSDFPKLTQALLDRGWRESHLAKLWGENLPGVCNGNR